MFSKARSWKNMSKNDKETAENSGTDFMDVNYA